ncbi:MAG: hypothetical protein MUE74_12250, partial [Bacteroidales bacterium]|nr:hypothetical protein [Bacteroidales bacterium]
MKTTLQTFILLAVMLLSGPATAQVASMTLWPQGIPGVVLNTNYTERTTVTDGLNTRFERVTSPALFPYLPPKESATGTAVLICPGGGYSALAFNHEG